ncbi:MAG: hypothetical protein ACXU8N_14910 [Telluria sp.]
MHIEELRRQHRRDIVDQAFQLNGISADYDHEKPRWAEFLLGGGRLDEMLGAFRYTAVRMDMFQSFVAEFIEVRSHGTAPRPLSSRCLETDLGRLGSAMSEHCDIYLDSALLNLMRSGAAFKLKKPLPPSQLNCLMRLVEHIYLALLRRFPSIVDAKRWAEVILQHQDIHVALNAISKAPEFLAHGYKRHAE